MISASEAQRLRHAYHVGTAAVQKLTSYEEDIICRISAAIQLLASEGVQAVTGCLGESTETCTHIADYLRSYGYEVTAQVGMGLKISWYK